MKIKLAFTFTPELRKIIGRILGHKRPATRTELIQVVTASVTAELVKAEEFDNLRDTDRMKDVPGQLGLFVSETNKANAQEIAS